jgi:quinol-cytochrome oxidoreductase complex cytochrome b subunit
MTYLAKIFFILGLILALIAGFLRATGATLFILPWLVGGTGIICGLFPASPRERNILFFSLIGLVAALSAILLQDFNPGWLTDVVFFVRVLFAHILLSFAFVHLVKIDRSEQGTT